MERGESLNQYALGPDTAMGHSSPMEILESEQTLFHHTLNGADPQRPFRRPAEDAGQAPIRDKFGVNVQLMSLGESIDEVDDMRLRSRSALRHPGGATVRLT